MSESLIGDQTFMSMVYGSLQHTAMKSKHTVCGFSASAGFILDSTDPADGLVFTLRSASYLVYSADC